MTTSGIPSGPPAQAAAPQWSRFGVGPTGFHGGSGVHHSEAITSRSRKGSSGTPQRNRRNGGSARGGSLSLSRGKREVNLARERPGNAAAREYPPRDSAAAASPQDASAYAAAVASSTAGSGGGATLEMAAGGGVVLEDNRERLRRQWPGAAGGPIRANPGAHVSLERGSNSSHSESSHRGYSSGLQSGPAAPPGNTGHNSTTAAVAAAAVAKASGNSSVRRPGTAERTTYVAAIAAATEGSAAEADSARSPIPPRPTTPCMTRGRDVPLPPRPTTPCLNRGGVVEVMHHAAPPQKRPTTPCLARNTPDAGFWAGASPPQPERVQSGATSSTPPRSYEEMPPTEVLPPRPTTPCMVGGRRSEGKKSKRTSSAGAASRCSSRNRPSSGSVGARMCELEQVLLSRRQQQQQMAPESQPPVLELQKDGIPPDPWSRPRSGRASVLGHAPSEGSSENYEAASATSPTRRVSGCHGALTRSPGATSSTRPPSSYDSGRDAVSSAACGGLAAQPGSLVEEAIAMCRSVRGAQSAETAVPWWAAADAKMEGGSMDAAALQYAASPRRPMERPVNPTPEQTSNWIQGLEKMPEGPLAEQDGLWTSGEASANGEHYHAGGARNSSGRGRPKPCSEQHEWLPDASASMSSRSPSPRALREEAMQRPRSPTPTKMLAAWEGGMDGGDSDQEALGGHTDGLIEKLISACQANNITQAFAQYEKLHRMGAPLYDGVYKQMIECCMRTQQLGQAMLLYESLKSSGQSISSRLAILLIEACAREQHCEKVQAIWQDWCPPEQPVAEQHCEVLLVALSALIRMMSPDAARDVLMDASRRSGDQLGAYLARSEVAVEELLMLNEAVAEDAQANGTLLGGLAASFNELHATLEELRLRCLREAESYESRPCADDLLMEDLDVDLDCA
eukprot:TRINITY_DN29419_c0_g1_i1.p1 TRINITY_DN29419_c0_g1~~TRINITY_DN29419_c0_g1_i1.p1  ORF type:complete len:922 (+),score=169.88 TRINITY_DN29419_c0_g1_i1:40-2766(+)